MASVEEGLIKQAILNLLINAVQAVSGKSDRDRGRHDVLGEVIVRVDGNAESVVIHVTDTGPGIEPDRLEEIFRPYVSGKRSGTGLGLPIARRIIDEHGGRLTVNSAPGQGSDFQIALPRGQT